MRDYSKVGPTFWTGETGKKLKAAGKDAVIVSLYLMTSPHSNMLGLYWVPKAYIAHETGLPLEGASEGLARACEAGFCRYDEASEVVWVIEMAAFQIADKLLATDNRCRGIQKDYDALPENPFLTAFYERYAVPFNMAECRGKAKPLGRGSKAPRKPGTGTGAGDRLGASEPRRASRLPTEWLPDETDIAFATSKGLTNGRVSTEVEKFKDHWKAASGASAVKLDWQAAWRTWVRRSVEMYGAAAPAKTTSVFDGAH